MVWRRLSPVLVVTAIALAACGGGSQALGGGEEVNACGGYEAYDALDEPRPDDADGTVEWAKGVLRIIERVDFEERIRQPDGDRIDVPKQVIDDYTTIETSIRTLRDGAGDDVAAAQRTLSRDEAFNAADARMASFFATNCS